MCNDSTEPGSLPAPDYTKPFSILIEEAMTYLLGPSIHATAWDTREQSMVTGKGCLLGRLSVSDSQEYYVDFTYSLAPSSGWRARLEDMTFCKDLHIGDILWQMAGAQHPSVIRPCGDHSDIVLVSIRIDNVCKGFSDPSPSDRSSSVMHWHEFRRYLPDTNDSITLIWDWSLMAEHIRQSHVSKLFADWTRIPHAVRLLQCARIFDKSNNHNGLVSLRFHQRGLLRTNHNTRSTLDCYFRLASTGKRTRGS